MHVPNLNTKKRKGLIAYYKTYGITTLKKNVDGNHVMIVKKIELELNGLIKRTLEKQLTKKRPNVSDNAISFFFIIKDPFFKNDVQQKGFLQDLDLLIVKNQLPLQFVESVWFKSLILHLCP
jgi:hypothetical protein